MSVLIDFTALQKIQITDRDDVDEYDADDYGKVDIHIQVEEKKR